MGESAINATVDSLTSTKDSNFGTDIDCSKELWNFCSKNDTRTTQMESLSAICNFTLNDTCTSLVQDVNDTDGDYPNMQMPTAAIDGRISLVLYSLIFLLAVVGNILVIVTLVQNKRMRTVTNIFLLSLAVSDLMFALFCMPMTIVGAILQNFIFGKGFCTILPYMQVCSVFVSIWTLVAISMERYFAICQPLTSRGWQTKAHAYKIIAAVWVVGFILFIPTAYFTKLTAIYKPHTYKCREKWPTDVSRQVYVTLMFTILMVIPLLVMVVAYALIILELWRGMNYEKRATSAEQEPNGSRKAANGDSKTTKVRAAAPRSTSNNAAKRRVVKMLMVVVLLFFVCWTPSWCLNMWALFDRQAVWKVSALDAAVIKLLTYISSCVNPITYCFMNKKFRQGFLEAFGCCSKSGTDTGTYSAVGSTRLRSQARTSPQSSSVRCGSERTPKPVQL
ncbi:cholecystokinin receptor type A-like [Glandiceps talaboti]